MTTTKPRPQPLVQPSKTSETLTDPHLPQSPMLLLMLPYQPHFAAQQNSTLTRCHSSTPTPTVFRNSFNALSITADNEEDHSEAMMTSHHHQALLPLCMCQPHLNTSETSIRHERHSIPHLSHPHHLPSNHLPPLE